LEESARKNTDGDYRFATHPLLGGFSFNADLPYCRLSSRSPQGMKRRINIIGFRVIKVIDPEGK
jgi:formylglycine-generating enzyme required for sulfatase activity